MADKDGLVRSGAKDGGVLGFAAAIALVSGVGVIAGFIMSPRNEIVSAAKQEDKSGTSLREGKVAGSAARGSETKHSNEIGVGAQDQVIPLEPLLVNISGPDVRWIRVEGAVAFTTPPKEDRALLLKQMSEDLLLYLRTLTLGEIGSSSGFEYMRDDLSELVRIRSKGRARAFILRTMVIE